MLLDSTCIVSTKINLKFPRITNKYDPDKPGTNIPIPPTTPQKKINKLFWFSEYGSKKQK